MTRSWKDVQRTVELVNAIFAFAVNFLAVHLIVRRSPKSLGPYKYLMMYMAIFEMFYSIMIAISSPVFFVYGSAFIAFLDMRHSFLNNSCAILALVIYCSSFGVSMAFFGIQFIYRYLVVIGSKLLSSFTGRRIVIWMSIPVISGVIWGNVTYFLGGPSASTSEHIRESLLERFEIRIEDIVYVGGDVATKSPHGEIEINYEHVIGILIVWTQLLLSLITIFYFGISYYLRVRRLVRNAALSAAYFGLQAQLFRALVTQTLIPVILMHFPISVLYACTFFGKDLGSTGVGLVSLAISLYPVIDPLPTIFMIRSYKKALFGYTRYLYC